MNVEVANERAVVDSFLEHHFEEMRHLVYKIEFKKLQKMMGDDILREEKFRERGDGHAKVRHLRSFGH